MRSGSAPERGGTRDADRTDPFRELDRLAQQLTTPHGSWSRPAAMPMDAYRHGAELVASERPRGVFSRPLFLGDTLDTDNITASYDSGALTLRIPVADQAKPRKIEISSGNGTTEQIAH